jgi:hypothetical protein
LGDDGAPPTMPSPSRIFPSLSQSNSSICCVIDSPSLGTAVLAVTLCAGFAVALFLVLATALFLRFGATLLLALTTLRVLDFIATLFFFRDLIFFFGICSYHYKRPLPACQHYAEKNTRSD